MRIRALDSIRGLLLLQMTLDHFGRPISHYLYQCFGFFSAAEGFFFLSGFVGMLAAQSKGAKDPGQRWMRWRAFKTWRYHMATLIALALAACFLMPAVSHFFDPLYRHPALGSLWSALLVNTPEWLDVLPLYVIFLLLGSFVFPHFVKAVRKRNIFLLWLPSLAVWIAGQFGARDLLNSVFPAWLHHGDFDPLGWQFVYFTGAAVSAWWSRARADERAGNPTAVGVVKKLTPAVFAALTMCFVWSHQFIAIELPRASLVDKISVGPLRFANFFLFMMAICWVVRKWPSLLDFRVTNVMGRASLDVYTAHIIFIYIWMSTPNSIRYHAPWNVIVPIVACVLLWALACLRTRKTAKNK